MGNTQTTHYSSNGFGINLTGIKVRSLPICLFLFFKYFPPLNDLQSCICIIQGVDYQSTRTCNPRIKLSINLGNICIAGSRTRNHNNKKRGINHITSIRNSSSCEQDTSYKSHYCHLYSSASTDTPVAGSPIIHIHITETPREGFEPPNPKERFWRPSRLTRLRYLGINNVPCQRKHVIRSN